MSTGKGRDVDLFVAIMSDSRIGWGTVAICGRAIAATGRLNLWMLEIGKKENDALELSNVLLEFGAANERVEVIWKSFLANGDEDAFRLEFSALVAAMESTIA